MIERARSVAAGFADVGLTQAEELLRRVSPEGRAQARREREARARRRRRVLVRLALAAAASLLTWALLALAVAPAVALGVAAALMLLLTILVLLRAAPRAPGREALAGATLPDLAAEAALWLAAQRRGLPAPALRLSETMAQRLEALAPRLAQLDPRSPAAAQVRALLAVELPDLVEGWRAVPISLRGAARDGGAAPDALLENGLRLIDGEIARVDQALGRGAVDGIAVRGRYLELKYDADGELG
ncbi:hypothetical protein KZ813_11160 [Sphingomonas sp. RHCKR7]|uniref:hypothetical protein n=1 Tax=Sphingomonas folli TaxID=2862497 RepID=UPI001CA52D5D|nr:hypothetical protein [Sphingomonas folli]MBW6527400.1 hypothetical protein [Sphingomonas folli]